MQESYQKLCSPVQTGTAPGMKLLWPKAPPMLESAI